MRLSKGLRMIFLEILTKIASFGSILRTSKSIYERKSIISRKKCRYVKSKSRETGSSTGAKVKMLIGTMDSKAIPP